jgi:hypothetical protein
MKRQRAWLGLVIVCGLGCSAGSAQAETCSADGKVCLLTESSPAQPLQLPARVTVTVPALTTPGLGWVPQSAQYATGGFGIERRTENWTIFPPVTTVEAILEPGPGIDTTSPPDGALTMYVEAWPYGSCGAPHNICDTLKAEFPLWVRTAVVDMAATLQRQGRRVVSTLGFTGRIPLRVETRLGLKAWRSYRCGTANRCTGLIEVSKRTRVMDRSEVGPGRYDFNQQLSLRMIERECRYRSPCQAFLTAYVMRADGYAYGVFKRSLTVSIKQSRDRATRARPASRAPTVTSYPSQVTFTATPNGGGPEGTGEHATVTIRSTKAICRQRRSFTVAIEYAPGQEKTYVYRTDGAGRWSLDTVAPIGPGTVVVSVPVKRLDQDHRCAAARTTVRLS